MNIAAVHYHFGSKEELLDAVVGRKAGPVNEARLKLLDQAEAEAVDGRPDVEKVLAAFLMPTAEMAHTNPKFVRLMGRLLSEGLMPRIVQRHFHDSAMRFVDALMRGLPHLSREELMWRVHFMIGSMAHTMTSQPLLPMADAGAPFPVRMQRLVKFLGAGFRAPGELEEVNKMRGIWAFLIAGTLAAEPLQLSLKRAVELAMSPEGSTRVQLSAEALEQARLRSAGNRARRCCRISPGRSTSRTRRATWRRSASASPSPIPGFSIPTFVGPFNTLDARVSGTQSVFDFSSIRRYQASKSGGVGRASGCERHRRAGGRAGGARLPGGAPRRCRRGGGEGQRRAVRSGAEAGREPEGARAPAPASRSRARAYNWPTTGSACWWRRTRAAAPACNCCAPWGCGWIRTWCSPTSWTTSRWTR